MTREEVAALAAGKEDVELAAIGRKYGLLPLACDFDGVDISKGPHRSLQFSSGNAFAALAIREGLIAADVRDISVLRKFCGEEVFKSIGPDGNEAPIHQTLFSDTPALV